MARCCACGLKLTDEDEEAYGDQCDDCVRAEYEPLPEIEQLDRLTEAARSIH